MTGRLIERDPKAKCKSKPYDGYAIFCDKDRAKIMKLLRVLNRLNLCIQCKDDAVAGNGMFDAIVQNGILASRCCLIFVSSDFKNDRLCVYFTQIAILQYLRMDKKLRIIPVCLDSTKLTCLQIFKEISTYKCSLGTVPEVILEEKLIAAIYKAMKMKGSREKSIFNSWKQCHCRLPYSFKKKRKILFFKNIKISKFFRFKYISTQGDCLYQKLHNINNLICKCLFDFHKWRKLVKLITLSQILSIIQYHFTTNLECHLHRFVKTGPSVCNIEERPIHEMLERCRFCRNMLLTSKLTEHEEECQMPINCETCNRLIAKTLKKQHESRCILEECLICNEWHPPSHDCPSTSSQATGVLEEMDLISQTDFSSLNPVAAQKCMEHSDVKEILNKLLNVVSQCEKKTKKKTKTNSNNLTALMDQLLDQLKQHKIIDQNMTDAIYKTAEQNKGRVGFSENSIDYFRYFIVAIELHCNTISLFDNQPTLVNVMCKTLPQSKNGFLRRFCKKKDKDSGQVFLPLVQNLFKM